MDKIKEAIENQRKAVDELENRVYSLLTGRIISDKINDSISNTSTSITENIKKGTYKSIEFNKDNETFTLTDFYGNTKTFNIDELRPPTEDTSTTTIITDRLGRVVAYYDYVECEILIDAPDDPVTINTGFVIDPCIDVTEDGECIIDHNLPFFKINDGDVNFEMCPNILSGMCDDEFGCSIGEYVRLYDVTWVDPELIEDEQPVQPPEPQYENPFVPIPSTPTPTYNTPTVPNYYSPPPSVPLPMVYIGNLCYEGERRFDITWIDDISEYYYRQPYVPVCNIHLQRRFNIDWIDPGGEEIILNPREIVCSDYEVRNFNFAWVEPMGEEITEKTIIEPECDYFNRKFDFSWIDYWSEESDLIIPDTIYDCEYMERMFAFSWIDYDPIISEYIPYSIEDKPSVTILITCTTDSEGTFTFTNNNNEQIIVDDLDIREIYCDTSIYTTRIDDDGYLIFDFANSCKGEFINVGKVTDCSECDIDTLLSTNIENIDIKDDKVIIKYLNGNKDIYDPTPTYDKNISYTSGKLSVKDSNGTTKNFHDLFDKDSINNIPVYYEDKNIMIGSSSTMVYDEYFNAFVTDNRYLNIETIEDVYTFDMYLDKENPIEKNITGMSYTGQGILTVEYNSTENITLDVIDASTNKVSNISISSNVLAIQSTHNTVSEEVPELDMLSGVLLTDITKTGTGDLEFELSHTTKSFEVENTVKEIKYNDLYNNDRDTKFEVVLQKRTGRPYTLRNYHGQNFGHFNTIYNTNDGNILNFEFEDRTIKIYGMKTSYPVDLYIEDGNYVVTSNKGNVGYYPYDINNGEDGTQGIVLDSLVDVDDKIHVTLSNNRTIILEGREDGNEDVITGLKKNENRLLIELNDKPDIPLDLPENFDGKEKVIKNIYIENDTIMVDIYDSLLSNTETLMFDVLPEYESDMITKFINIDGNYVFDDNNNLVIPATEVDGSDAILGLVNDKAGDIETFTWGDGKSSSIQYHGKDATILTTYDRDNGIMYDQYNNELVNIGQQVDGHSSITVENITNSDTRIIKTTDNKSYTLDIPLKASDGLIISSMYINDLDNTLVFESNYSDISLNDVNGSDYTNQLNNITIHENGTVEFIQENNNHNTSQSLSFNIEYIKNDNGNFLIESNYHITNNTNGLDGAVVDDGVWITDFTTENDTLSVVLSDNTSIELGQYNGSTLDDIYLQGNDLVVSVDGITYTINSIKGNDVNESLAVDYSSNILTFTVGTATYDIFPIRGNDSVGNVSNVTFTPTSVSLYNQFNTVSETYPKFNFGMERFTESKNYYKNDTVVYNGQLYINLNDGVYNDTIIDNTWKKIASDEFSFNIFKNPNATPQYSDSRKVKIHLMPVVSIFRNIENDVIYEVEVSSSNTFDSSFKLEYDYPVFEINITDGLPNTLHYRYRYVHSEHVSIWSNVESILISGNLDNIEYTYTDKNKIVYPFDLMPEKLVIFNKDEIREIVFTDNVIDVINFDYYYIIFEGGLHSTISELNYINLDIPENVVIYKDDCQQVGIMNDDIAHLPITWNIERLGSIVQYNDVTQLDKSVLEINDRVSVSVGYDDNSVTSNIIIIDTLTITNSNVNILIEQIQDNISIKLDNDVYGYYEWEIKDDNENILINSTDRRLTLKDTMLPNDFTVYVEGENISSTITYTKEVLGTNRINTPILTGYFKSTLGSVEIDGVYVYPEMVQYEVMRKENRVKDVVTNTNISSNFDIQFYSYTNLYRNTAYVLRVRQYHQRTGWSSWSKHEPFAFYYRQSNLSYDYYLDELVNFDKVSILFVSYAEPDDYDYDNDKRMVGRSSDLTYINIDNPWEIGLNEMTVSHGFSINGKDQDYFKSLKGSVTYRGGNGGDLGYGGSAGYFSDGLDAITTGYDGLGSALSFDDAENNNIEGGGIGLLGHYDNGLLSGNIQHGSMHDNNAYTVGGGYKNGNPRNSGIGVMCGLLSYPYGFFEKYK